MYWTNKSADCKYMNQLAKFLSEEKNRILVCNPITPKITSSMVWFRKVDRQ